MLRNVILLCLFALSVVQSACTNAANNRKESAADPSVLTTRNAENTSPSHRSDAHLPPSTAATRDSRIPQKVYTVLEYVRTHGQAMDGYVGGRSFGNREQVLPRQAADGRRLKYQEWDVNPKVGGRNRGAERLVTGSDGRAWFTSDHYQHFTEVK